MTFVLCASWLIALLTAIMSWALVHGLWRYIPEQFDDYITNPKSNGYRSLHTAVIAENKSLEVQIRTR